MATFPWDRLSKVVPTNSSFAFIEDVARWRSEYQIAVFCRLDDKGAPIVKGVPFSIFNGNWTNVGFCNELLFFRSADEPYWNEDYPSPFTCYVAHGDLMQMMRIPSHPYENLSTDYADVDNGYSIVALGLSWLDSDRWKLVAVLKTNMRLTTFGDKGFAKVGTFDPETGAWTTEPALFSDDFKCYESDSNLFYLNSSPVYHGDALYWVHGWNSSGPDNPRNARYPWNANQGPGQHPGYACKQRPLSLLKLCLKTNNFSLLHMPPAVDKQAVGFSSVRLNDKRNVGLLCKSEEAGRLTYCHLCPTEGLRVWVLDKDHHHNMVWRQTYCIPAEAIEFYHNDESRDKFINYASEMKRLRREGLSEDSNGIFNDYVGGGEEDMECRVCNEDFVSVLAFNEELHTILFKLNGCSDDIVCFNLEEKKVVSHYLYTDYCRATMYATLEVDPTVPLREVARSWNHLMSAPFKDEEGLMFSLRVNGLLDDDSTSQDDEPLIKLSEVPVCDVDFKHLGRHLTDEELAPFLSKLTDEELSIYREYQSQHPED